MQVKVDLQLFSTGHCVCRMTELRPTSEIHTNVVINQFITTVEYGNIDKAIIRMVKYNLTGEEVSKLRKNFPLGACSMSQQIDDPVKELKCVSKNLFDKFATLNPYILIGE